jgi:hypothetical protein
MFLEQRQTKLRNQSLMDLLSSSQFSPFLAAHLYPGLVDEHYLHSSLPMFPEPAQKNSNTHLAHKTFIHTTCKQC